MGQLHNSHILIGIDSCDFKIAPDQMVSIFFVETIIALKLLNGGFRSIGLIGRGAWSDLDGLFPANQRAAQFVDDKGRAVRVGLCMFCLLNSQGIAGILYQSILKAASGAQKRPFIFPAEPNGPQGAIHALMRVARRPPESVKSF